MTLRIISAESTLFEGEVDFVTLPGAKGRFTVLRNHASLLSTLTKGEITYVNSADSSRGSIAVNSGVADVDRNVVSVCVY